MQVIEFKEFGRPIATASRRTAAAADANTADVRIQAALVNSSDVKNIAARMSQTPSIWRIRPALGERLGTNLAGVRGRNQRKLPVKRMELKPDLALIPRVRYVTG